ncbi:hypothetical protein ScPMuIL_012236 [Solemya velum]
MAFTIRSYKDVGAFLVLLYVGASSAYVTFNHQDCSTSPSTAIRVTHASVYPHPIQIPGPIGITPYVEIEIRSPMISPITLEVRVTRKLMYVWVDIPCIARVGSCAYDFCEMTERSFGEDGCPRQLAASNFPCTCPIQPGNYTLYAQKFDVERVSRLWSWLAEGDYMLEVKLKNTSTREELGCSKLKLSIQRPCSSWYSCMLGK